MKVSVLTYTVGGQVGLTSGDILQDIHQTTPTGFLKCNGGYVSKTTYPELFAIIGNSFDSTVALGLNYVSYCCVGNGKPWQNQYDISTTQASDITGWSAVGSLPSPVSGSHVIVTNSRVYLLGGNDGTNTPVPTVYTAPINPDGTLGTWVTGTNLPIRLSHSQAIVTRNRVYLIGGYTTNPAGFISSVYTAAINTDGTLGIWTIDASIPAPLGESQAIVTKNRVYLLGGNNGVVDVSFIYTAPINLDGTLGLWSIFGSLPTPFSYTQAIVTKNRVYLLTGFNGSANVSTVYTAPINANGTLGAWGVGTSLPTAMTRSQAIVTNSRVYLLGGYDGSTYVSTVYTAPINVDGTLGAWVTSVSLPLVISNSQAIVTKNRVYLIGGVNAIARLSSVYTAPFLDGVNDYSPYYNGFINKFNGSNPVSVANPSTATKFGLPDYTTFDASTPGAYSYIKT